MIKKFMSVLMVTMLSVTVYAQETEPTEAEIQAVYDSIENSYTYQYGKIELKNGVGAINVPRGFKYLDAEQSKRVLVDLWGNPDEEDMTMGLIMPEKYGVLSDHGYVFNIMYDEIGYVKDDDADDIDYSDLLKDMKEETREASKTRLTMGYDPIDLIGWATPPYYDKDRKILHWAKEIQFGTDSIHTLNYNVRVLGRKGVLILNAIGSMEDLGIVQQDIPQVLNIVEFNDGYKYKDFDPSVDEVAAWTIGGLVAGKVLAKVGFFAVIAKFGKFIVIGLIAFFGAIYRRITGKKKKEDEDTDSENQTPEQLTPEA